MTVRALSDRLIERLPEMTPQLALGARFIVDHPDTMVISSMREIAGRVGVAPATLLRLARMLGYEDWSRFRDVYVDHFRSSSPHYAEKADALSKRQGVPRLVEEVTRAQAAALQHAATANTADAIDAAAKLLSRAPRIFVAAFMSCRAPGLAFTYICRLFRSNVLLLGSEGHVPGGGSGRYPCRRCGVVDQFRALFAGYPLDRRRGGALGGGAGFDRRQPGYASFAAREVDTAVRGGEPVVFPVDHVGCGTRGECCRGNARSCWGRGGGAR